MIFKSFFENPGRTGPQYPANTNLHKFINFSSTSKMSFQIRKMGLFNNLTPKKFSGQDQFWNQGFFEKFKICFRNFPD